MGASCFTWWRTNKTNVAWNPINFTTKQQLTTTRLSHVSWLMFHILVLLLVCGHQSLQMELIASWGVNDGKKVGLPSDMTPTYGQQQQELVAANCLPYSIYMKLLILVHPAKEIILLENTLIYRWNAQKYWLYYPK